MKSGGVMVRVAYRISPLPNDADHFKQFVHAVHAFQSENLLESQLDFVRSKVPNAKGKEYSYAMIRGILNNLESLNLLRTNNDATYGLTRFGQRLTEADSAGDWFQENFIDMVYGDGFNSMSQNSSEHLHPSHTYLVPFLLDILDSFRGSGREMTVGEVRKSLLATGDEASSIHGYVDIHRTTTTELSAADRATAIRPYTEACKLLSLTGALTKNGSKWSLNSTEAQVEAVRKKLRECSYEHYLADIISALGSNNAIFHDVGLRFIPSACRYIAYRYSGAINRSQGLAFQAMKDLKPIRKHVLDRYRKAKRGAHGTRESFRRLLTDDRNLQREVWITKFPTRRNIISSLGLDVLSQLNGFDDERAHQFLSFLESEENLQSTELDGIKHGHGAYSWNPDITLHKWQEDALNAWERAGHWGVVSAVTGTGKTIFSIAAAKRFLDTHPDGRVTVIVPSIVLLHQWLREFAKCLDLSLSEVGLRGGGYLHEYSNDRRIMVWVVNSAVKEGALQDMVAGLTNHMMILDECHEYGGDSYKQVMDVQHNAALAISATPAEGEHGRKHPVEAIYGAPIFHVGYKRAHEEGLISDFQVRYVRLNLSVLEQREYDSLSEQLRSARRDLMEQHPHLYDEVNFHAAIQKLLSSGEGSGLAAKFMKLTSDRIWVVKNAIARDEMMARVLPSVRDNSTTSIVFTERIAEIDDMISYRPKHETRDALATAEEPRKKAVQAITGLLNDTGVMNYGVYHSKFPTPWKKWMVDWFRAGLLRTMFSVRALAQGFDLPGAEVGIIRSSSPNVRLRIQTIGRMIRRASVEKTAIIWIAYVAGTSEERIFSSHNWADEFPDVDNIQQHYRLPTADDEDDVVTDQSTGLVLIGGEDTLPQFDRDLTEEEIESIDESQLAVGQTPVEQRINRHISEEIILVDGVPHLIVDGVKREITIRAIFDAAEVVKSMGNQVRLPIAKNGHIISWIRSSWIYLGKVDISELDTAKNEAASVMYTAEDFFKDWSN